MDEAYKRFPPGQSRLRIPVSPRAAALAGLALLPACTPKAIWGQRLAWLLVRVAGGRALPGPAESWTPPMPRDCWEALWAAWRQELGAFDALAVYQRPQGSRRGCAFLLMRGGRAVAFVKASDEESDALQQESRVHRQVWESTPRGFAVPEPLGQGRIAAWEYFATAPLPPGLHSMASDPPLASIGTEIQEALRPIPRPTGTPAHWRPMHGDFAPWNLRQPSSGPLVLVDWEGAQWAPPAADEVYYRAGWAAVGGPRTVTEQAGEAVRYWTDRVRARPAAGRDARFQRALLAALATMDTHAG